MAGTNPTHRPPHDPTSLIPRDKKAERAVLGFLIYRYPKRLQEGLTIPGLSQEFSEGPGDFGSDDAIERAVRELVGAGLLECRGAFVVPTRAALYYDALEAA